MLPFVFTFGQPHLTTTDVYAHVVSNVRFTSKINTDCRAIVMWPRTRSRDLARAHALPKSVSPDTAEHAFSRVGKFQQGHTMICSSVPAERLQRLRPQYARSLQR